MRVLKRNGVLEEVRLDKITERIENLCNKEPKLDIDSVAISQKVCSQLKDGITTKELDDLSSEICIAQSIDHPKFGELASRIAIDDHQKNTPRTFKEAMRILYDNKDVNGNDAPLISEKVLEVSNNPDIESAIDYERDFDFDFFGFKTIQRAYLLRTSTEVVEKAQHMWMRVSIGIHGENIPKVIETYEYLSKKYFIHATPTLFHAGTPRPQLSSCFLLGTGDSVEDMYKTVSDCAKISKWAGGIGLHMSNVRSRDSYIRGTGGKSSGILPLLRVLNATARHINQCFAPETRIYTQNGLKEIKDIEKNVDKVVTVDGTLRTVIDVFVNDVDKEILEIKPAHMETPVRVTKEHQIFVIRQKTYYNNEFDTEYVSAGDLKQGDFVCFPTPKEDIPDTSGLGFCFLKNKIPNFFRKDDREWSPIEEIKTVHYQGPVYDLSVEDNHNYMTTMGLVHNSGKRLGSFAIYLEPWHGDIFEFLEARKNTGAEEERARDLFYAMWMPDLFMKRVEDDATWSLMCPDKCPGLSDAYGDKFEELYTHYEKDGKFERQVKAREIWNEIINSQIETGLPYMVYKDACNKKSNQKNVGTIKSSNLCTEIIEYSDKNEYAVCNLASVSLPKFVKENPNVQELRTQSVKVYSKSNCEFCVLAKNLLDEYSIPYTEENLDEDEKRDDFFTSVNCKGDFCLTGNSRIKTVPQIFVNDERLGGYTDLLNHIRPNFDHIKLYEITSIITRNLNKIIDVNFYPTPETKRSNMRHRPIGIGGQGLADLFILMKMPFDSPEAEVLNRELFETIYYSSMKTSMELAKAEIRYETFDGSPLSHGQFQFDLWEGEPVLNGRWDWQLLRKDVVTHGARNSLLLAPMPTASTSQILGNNECIEPYTSNVYTRRTLAGEFVVMNKHLVKTLLDMGLWNKQMKEKLIVHRGSVQNIPEIPGNVRKLYKTAWEIKQKVLVDLAIQRGHFVCQSQSLNVFVESPTYQTLSKIHFYGWKNGLKTGTYYIRSKPKINSQQFTISPEDACENCSA